MSYEIDGVRLVDDVGNVYDIEEWLDLHGYVELPRDANGITDELREFVDGADGYELWCPRHKKELTAIADRIDAAHKKAMSEQPYTIDMVPMTDERMAEHGWVRKDKVNIISNAAINVALHIDWQHVADELIELAETIRGMGIDSQ